MLAVGWTAEAVMLYIEMRDRSTHQLRIHPCIGSTHPSIIRMQPAGCVESIDPECIHKPHM